MGIGDPLIRELEVASANFIRILNSRNINDESWWTQLEYITHHIGNLHDLIRGTRGNLFPKE